MLHRLADLDLQGVVTLITDGFVGLCDAAELRVGQQQQLALNGGGVQSRVGRHLSNHRVGYCRVQVGLVRQVGDGIGPRLVLT